MFDRFTERARRVMTLARQEAQGLDNDFIGTEHVLLGLVSAGDGVAVQALKGLGLDLARVRAETERLVERGREKVTARQLPFTPRVKRVLERALEEALDLGHNHIGTEHLLLGLIRERDGPAAIVLENLGIRAELVRAEVLDRFAAGPPTPLYDKEARDLEHLVLEAILDRFPGGDVVRETERRMTSRGDGLSVLIAWSPDPGKRPLASVSFVARRLEVVRAQLPAVLDLLAALIAKEKEAPGGATE